MDWSRYLLVASGAALATLCYAVLFNVPRRSLPFAALVGMAGRMAFEGARDLGLASYAAAFAGGLTVGLLVVVGARLLRTPSTIFTIPGFIPLVPGTLALRALRAFLNNNTALGVPLTVQTLLIGGAIAAGLGLGALVNQSWRRHHG